VISPVQVCVASAADDSGKVDETQTVANAAASRPLTPGDRPAADDEAGKIPASSKPPLHPLASK